MYTIPNEISESAFVDGSSHITIYSRIILPLIKPAISTLIIIGGLGIWNDFFLPFILFTNGKITTIPLTIYQYMQEHGHQWTLICADMLYSIVPVIVIFIFLQKYILSGVVAGSVKG